MIFTLVTQRMSSLLLRHCANTSSKRRRPLFLSVLLWHGKELLEKLNRKVVKSLLLMPKKNQLRKTMAKVMKAQRKRKRVRHQKTPRMQKRKMIRAHLLSMSKDSQKPKRERDSSTFHSPSKITLLEIQLKNTKSSKRSKMRFSTSRKKTLKLTSFQLVFSTAKVKRSSTHTSRRHGSKTQSDCHTLATATTSCQRST